MVGERNERASCDPVCSKCDGFGFIVEIDHHPECYKAGDCVNCGGVQVQVQCPKCTEDL